MNTYESAIVLAPQTSPADIKEFKAKLVNILKEQGADIILEDDWGVRTFAQPTSKGVRSGVFLYTVYRADENFNKELERQLKIDDRVLKYLLVRLNDGLAPEEIVKSYKKPSFETDNQGRVMRSDDDKDRKIFAKKRACWFKAKGISPDWKDPKTYSWVVSEFGKISPARVTGVSAYYQREVTKTIKRARTIGFISYISNRVAH